MKHVSLVLHSKNAPVKEHVTVAAHSASRCELLERMGWSFRVVYQRLPILVTCECPESEVGLAGVALAALGSNSQHPMIPRVKQDVGSNEERLISVFDMIMMRWGHVLYGGDH